MTMMARKCLGTLWITLSLGAATDPVVLAEPGSQTQPSQPGYPIGLEASRPAAESQ